MPRHRIPTHYTLHFMATTVDGWLPARVCGESRKAFAKSRSVPRPSLQNWERQIHRLREKIRRHSRAGPSFPPVLPRESRLTLSGSDHMSISTPVEDTLCVFSKDERRLEHTVTIDIIIEAAADFMPAEIGTKSYEGK
ncbi:hypothetical protein JG688_00012969 [Phytophthora aleatoria]|uniref:Uncharacterized protein n=1 Tax=Phytophthora aleatoria TaxID=2496075 RepID=A0A8J5IJT9_9STRA|nr:hypothetical protein JG688_00012969 [Phytophthora aleatoria]